MFDKIVNNYRNAADDAMRQLGQVTNVPLIKREDHLLALRNMSESDLDALAEEFGVDQVAEYLARLAGGNHANRT